MAIQDLNNKLRVRKKKPKQKTKEQVFIPPPPPDTSSFAKDIQKAIKSMPTPNITVSPPNVTVKPTDVTVNVDAKEIGQEIAKEMNRLRPLPAGYHAQIERGRGDKMTGAIITRIMK